MNYGRYTWFINVICIFPTICRKRLKSRINPLSCAIRWGSGEIFYYPFALPFFLWYYYLKGGKMKIAEKLINDSAAAEKIVEKTKEESRRANDKLSYAAPNKSGKARFSFYRNDNGANSLIFRVRDFSLTSTKEILEFK